MWNHFSNSIGPEDSKGAVHTQFTMQNVDYKLIEYLDYIFHPPTYNNIKRQSPCVEKLYMLLEHNVKHSFSKPPTNNVNF